MKKKFLAIFAAAAMFLTGCGGNDAPEQITEKEETTSEAASEETTAAESINVYETLAEGQKRDWKIEDVLKNDLEIDGIPISLPCTLKEMLDTLGDEYSVDESDFVYEGEVITSTKYFTGESVVLMLYYNNDVTNGLLFTISESKDINEKTLNVHSLLSGLTKGVVSLKDLPVGSSMEDCINKYGNPNQIKDGSNGKTYFMYEDDSCKMQISFKNNMMIEVSGCGFKTEETEIQ